MAIDESHKQTIEGRGSLDTKEYILYLVWKLEVYLGEDGENSYLVGPLVMLFLDHSTDYVGMFTLHNFIKLCP